MSGFVLILGLSFLYTVVVCAIKLTRGGWHATYGQAERINILVTSLSLAVYGAYVLGGS